MRGFIIPSGGKVNDTSRLTYETRIYLRWKEYGDLPARSLYELPADLAYTLLGIDAGIGELGESLPATENP